MTRWTALVPLKLGADCKSRLAEVLTAGQRLSLAERMAGHVIAELGKVDAIGEVVVLAAGKALPWPVRTVPDSGRGLNRELDEAVGTIGGGVLVIHADLPLVEAHEIASLLLAADTSGFALAPDRDGSGSNALALTCVPQGFAFAFGPASRAAHCEALGPGLAIMQSDGLAADIDTPEDLALIGAPGFVDQAR